MFKYVFSLWILLSCLFTAQLAIGQSYSQTDLKQIKALAKTGNPRATYQMGQIYEKGLGGTKVNLNKAFKYYEKAANSNYDSALLSLGNLYESGSGPSQSISFAVNYYIASAAQNNAEANYRLGNIYYAGAGEVPKDTKKAVDYYLTAFRLGDKRGLSNLSSLPVENLADKKRIGYLLYMAEKGDAENLYKVGKYYQNGSNGLPKDESKAFRSFFEAAQKNHHQAQYELGKIYTEGMRTATADVPRNMRLAVLNLIRAANGGVEAAKQELNGLNLDIYIDKNNPDYVQYISGQGSENMGVRYYGLYKNYLTGKGVKREPRKALEYCQRSALEGYLPAMLELGNMYERGFLVKANDANAFQWYQEAANNKSDTAYLVLANMYATGKGTKIDPEKAVRWYLKAAKSSQSNIAGKAMFQLSKFDITRHINPDDLDYVSYMANKGDTESQMRVANYFYSQGNNDAVYWYTKAANSDVVAAQQKLGYIYLNGELQVIQDIRQSVQYFYQAALQNDLASMKELAILFSENKIPDEPDYYTKGYSLSQKYLELTKNDPQKRDLFIYKVIGDLSTTTKDYKNAIAYYTAFINAYNTQMNKPLQLVKAINSRAIAYFLMNDLASASNDISISIIELDQYRNHPDIRPEYIKLKGLYHYHEGRILFAANQNDVACEAFLKARQYGTEPEERFIQGCVTGQNRRF